MRNNKSFTIVELLVVMAVIGVLLSLAVFGIQALQKNQRETQRMQDLKNIQGQLEAFYTKYRRYPVSGSNNNAELRVNGNNPEINVGFQPDPSSTFATIPIQSMTPLILVGNYDTYDCNDPFNTPSADNWNIIYATIRQDLNPNPQVYELFGCTEGGKTNNLGGSDDLEYND